MPTTDPGGFGVEPLRFEGFRVEVMGDERVVLVMVGEGEGDDLAVDLDTSGAADIGAAMVEAATGRRPDWVPSTS